jgi:hypothetical protein
MEASLFQKIEEAMKDACVCKCVSQNYVVYDRRWLFEHLDMEFDLLKKAKELKNE